MSENHETGRICFDCGQPEFADDKGFEMRVRMGTYVVVCCDPR